MFARMSKRGRADQRRALKPGAIAASATAPADVKAAAAQLGAKADAMRKEIVATTEGGAITGEERLREHVDEIYGAINSVEDRPTAYQMARIDALDRELKEVEAQWAAFKAGDVAAFNAKLKAANLPPLTIAEVELDPDEIARGGRSVGARARAGRDALLRQCRRSQADRREGLSLFGRSMPDPCSRAFT